jgi:hypothetical protein
MIASTTFLLCFVFEEFFLHLRSLQSLGRYLNQTPRQLNSSGFLYLLKRDFICSSTKPLAEVLVLIYIAVWGWSFGRLLSSAKYTFVIIIIIIIIII